MEVFPEKFSDFIESASRGVECQFLYKGFALNLRRALNPANPREKKGNVADIWCLPAIFSDESFNPYKGSKVINLDNLRTVLTGSQEVELLRPIASVFDSSKTMGFAFVTNASFRLEYDELEPGFTPEHRDRLKEKMDDEVYCYQQYLKGETFMAEVVAPDGKVIAEIYDIYGVKDMHDYINPLKDFMEEFACLPN